MKKTTSLLTAAALAFTLVFTGCGGSTSSAPESSAEQSVSSAAESSTQNEESVSSAGESPSQDETAHNSSDSNPETSVWTDALYKEDTELGEGANTVKVEVSAEGKSVTLTVHSDKDNLADILTDNGLVEGDESEFGLYIKKVIGITADYDIDQSFWGLYKDGEMTATGASGITIADGDHYELVYTPAEGVSANTDTEESGDDVSDVSGELEPAA